HHVSDSGQFAGAANHSRARAGTAAIGSEWAGGSRARGGAVSGRRSTATVRVSHWTTVASAVVASGGGRACGAGDDASHHQRWVVHGAAGAGSGGAVCSL